MTEALRTAVEAKQRSALLIWSCLIGAVIFYGVVPAMLLLTELGAADPDQKATLALLVPLFSVLGLASACLSIFISRYAYSESGLLKVLSKDPATAGPAERRLSKADEKAVEGLSPDEGRLLAVAEYLRVRSILSTTICDSIAVFGLVLTLISRTPEYSYIGAFVGVLVALTVRPKLLEGVEQAELLQAKAPR